MNAKNLLLTLLTSSALILSDAAFSADTDKAEASTPSKSENVEKPKTKKVKPHSHPRDEKHIAVGDKSDSKASGAAEESDEGKMKPHSHQRDAK